MTEIFIALGANATRGGVAPRDALKAALERLELEDFRLARRSSYYRTPCFPPGAGPDFVNAVAEFVTDLSPVETLARLHAVEAGHGRERRRRWAPRTLDLDLLSAGDAVLPDAATYRRWRDLPPARQKAEAPAELILPHPRIQDRAFVLVPLAQIAPDWCHPVSGATAADMRDALPAADRAGIVALE